MSREIRRVPLDFKHPTKYNPNWLRHSMSFLGVTHPESKLHDKTEMFIPLYEPSYSVALKQYFEDKVLWDAGKHKSQEFPLNYHSPLGYLNKDGSRNKPTPYQIYNEDETQVISEHFFSNIDDLLKYMPWESEATMPRLDSHMPDFPEDAVLGYCLYETVSEGTPVTPVFATEDELIEHLVTVGQDWDQVPLRRASAEAIVRTGGSLASAVVIGNQLLDSTKDADIIESLSSKG